MSMSDPQSAPQNHKRMVANEPFENLTELALRRSNDFRLFGAVNNDLTCKQLAADTDMKQAVASWLRILGMCHGYMEGRIKFLKHLFFGSNLNLATDHPD